MDRKAFFDSIRDSMFHGTLAQTQVEGVNDLLDAHALVATRIAKHQLAYCFATAYRETWFTMQPIKEVGTPGYFRHRYDINGANPSLARRLGNYSGGDGAKYCGRGYAQTTGKANYTKLTKLVRASLVGETVDFVADPDALLQPKYAGIALFDAMDFGIYTGKCLNDYIDETSDEDDFVQARRIINGQDRATDFAADAVKVLAALDKAGA